jgi:hypothetical protein
MAEREEVRQALLAEATWRFNRRLDLTALVLRLTVAVVTCDPHPEGASAGNELCPLRVDANQVL